MFLYAAVRLLAFTALDPHKVFDDRLFRGAAQFDLQRFRPVGRAATLLLARGAVLGLVLLDAGTAFVLEPDGAVLAPRVLAVFTLLQRVANRQQQQQNMQHALVNIGHVRRLVLTEARVDGR